MKINCLHCGHAFGLDDSYGDYEGLVRCPTCAGILDIRVQDEMIKCVRPGSLTPAVSASATAPPTETHTAPIAQVTDLPQSQTTRTAA